MKTILILLRIIAFIFVVTFLINSLVFSNTNKNFSHHKFIPELIYVKGGSLLFHDCNQINITNKFQIPNGEKNTYNITPQKVILSNFYISQQEITVGQFQKFILNVNNDSLYFSQYYSTITPNYFHKSENDPITVITWSEAIYYCNWLSEKTGKEKVYLINEDILPYYNTAGSNIFDLKINYSANGFRLPTEAEWEYVCKLNKKLKAQKLNDMVIMGLSNGIGEWCNDWYSSVYPKESIINPTGPNQITFNKIIRGLSDSKNEFNNCCKRSFFPIYETKLKIGFRIVCK